MPKPRGREHTTLTETAQLVVRVVERIPGIKMIAPGEIKTTKRRKAGSRHITIVTTTAGCELLITGQSMQKVAVHTNDVATLTSTLRQAKTLRDFTIKERSRLPNN